MSAAAYQTLAGEGASEWVVDRSRFLGFAQPIESIEAAQQIVAALRKKHYDARHVCYGLRVGLGAQCVDRSNDDGEPARTGGYPLWQLLDGDDLTDALVVVVRYFGGIKLGTGGLARAYREAGRLALADAGIKTIHPETEVAFHIDYTTVDRLQHHLSKIESVRVVDVEYAADVMFTLAVWTSDLAEVRLGLAALLQRDPDAL